MQPDLMSQLTTLLIHLDSLTDRDSRNTDDALEDYYYGFRAGIKIARDDLARIMADAIHAQVKAL
jgi:hypothetical protein